MELDRVTTLISAKNSQKTKTEKYEYSRHHDSKRNTRSQKIINCNRDRRNHKGKAPLNRPTSVTPITRQSTSNRLHDLKQSHQNKDKQKACKAPFTSSGSIVKKTKNLPRQSLTVVVPKASVVLIRQFLNSLLHEGHTLLGVQLSILSSHISLIVTWSKRHHDSFLQSRIRGHNLHRPIHCRLTNPVPVSIRRPCLPSDDSRTA